MLMGMFGTDSAPTLIEVAVPFLMLSLVPNASALAPVDPDFTPLRLAISLVMMQ